MEKACETDVFFIRAIITSCPLSPERPSKKNECGFEKSLVTGSARTSCYHIFAYFAAFATANHHRIDSNW